VEPDRTIACLRVISTQALPPSCTLLCSALTVRRRAPQVWGQHGAHLANPTRPLREEHGGRAPDRTTTLQQRPGIQQRRHHTRLERSRGNGPILLLIHCIASPQPAARCYVAVLFGLTFVLNRRVIAERRRAAGNWFLRRPCPHLERNWCVPFRCRWRTFIAHYLFIY